MKQLSNHLKLITIKIFISAFVFTLLPVSAEEVNVYSHRHYEADDKLFQKFTKNTGIKVNIVKASADALIERIKAEGKQSPADILITADAGRLVRAQDAGLLQTASSPSLNKQVPKHMRDKDGHWYGFTVRSRVLIYSKERINPSRLSTYEDLADPKWKGKLLTRSSSNIYNQSLLASIIANNGKQSAMKWAAAVRKNMARPPEGSDRDQMRAVAAGIGDVAIANTYYVGLLVNSSNPKDQEVAKKVGVFFPNQKGRGAHINISGGGIVKWSKNKANAVKLLEFLTGPEAQEQFPNATYEFPLEINSTNSELLQSWGKFKADSLSLSELGKLNSEAVKIFALSNWK